MESLGISLGVIIQTLLPVVPVRKAKPSIPVLYTLIVSIIPLLLFPINFMILNRHYRHIGGLLGF